MVETARGSFCVYQWHPEMRGILPSLVLTHATGFHARCWDQVVAHLGKRHVVAMDLRGHGLSPPQPFQDWFAFCDDLVAVLASLQVVAATGVGHSMGGFCSVGAALQRNDLFTRLLLIDPVILAPQQYALWDPSILASEPRHFTAKRRARFASAGAFRRRIGDKPPYNAFDPAVLHDYCRHALRPIATGEVELACAPVFEARIYETYRANAALLKGLHQIAAPVCVVRAMQVPSPEAPFDFRYSPTWPRLAQQFPRGEDRLLPQESHFLPLEKPALIAQLIERLEADTPAEQ